LIYEQNQIDGEPRNPRSLAAPRTREESLKKTVEDRFIMKNFYLITALAMLTGTFVLNPNAQAQSTPAQQPQAAPDQKEVEFVQSWYDACIGKKPIDNEKCNQLSKELVEKYPNHSEKKYIEYANKKIVEYKYSKVSDKFNTEFKEFYAQKPDAAKLDALLTAGDDFLEVESDPQSPNHLYAVGHLALATHRSVLAEVYNNYDRVKIYAEKALKSFETLSPPEKYKKDYTDLNLANLRELVLANMNQCLGVILTRTKPDAPEAQAEALAYFDKSLKVRSQESKDIGWKDPYTYQLRRNIYTKQYLELRKKYDALTDEEKLGETGKGLLKQVNEILDNKLIPEEARLIAVVGSNPQLSEVKTETIDEFNNFWKFRVDDSAKAPAYLKAFEADPTVAGPPVPAKADDGTGAAAPNAPNVTGSTKATPGASGVPGAKPAATGSKPPTKGKTTPKTRKSRRR
jgi:hypothetical protein